MNLLKISCINYVDAKKIGVFKDLHIFKNGFKPDIAANIISYGYKSIDDLIKKAKGSETVLRKKGQSEVAFQSSHISTL